MEQAMQRQSILPEKWLNAVNKIVYSDWYLLALVALAVIFWATQTMVAGLIVFCLLLGVLLVIKRDLTPVIPIFLYIYTVISKGEFPPYFWYLFIVLVPVVGGIIFHLVYYTVKKPSIGKMGIAFLWFAAALFMGGINSNQLNDEVRGLAFAAFLGLFPFVIYLVIINYSTERSAGETASYITRAFVFLGVLILAQMLIYYIRVWVGIIPPHSEVHLGWGVSNIVGNVLLATMPVTMYVAAKSTKKTECVIFALLAIAQFVAIIATVSRGAILVGCVTFAMMIIAGFFTFGHKKIYAVIVTAIVVAVAVVVAVKFDWFKAFIERAFSNGLDGSGRDAIYAEAVEVFRQNKLFGVGLGYIGKNSYLNAKAMYLWHSTFFHTIAALGLFGLAAVVFMYYKRIRLAFAFKDAFNIFWIIACIGFEGYAMMDTITYSAVPGLLIIAVMTAVNELSNRSLAQKAEQEKTFRNRKD